MQTSDEEIQKLREHILAEIDLTREMSDTEIRAIVSEKCSIYGKQKFLKLSEQEALEQYLFHSLRKLDVLQELLCFCYSTAYRAISIRSPFTCRSIKRIILITFGMQTNIGTINIIFVRNAICRHTAVMVCLFINHFAILPNGSVTEVYNSFAFIICGGFTAKAKQTRAGCFICIYPVYNIAAGNIDDILKIPHVAVIDVQHWFQRLIGIIDCTTVEIYCDVMTSCTIIGVDIDDFARGIKRAVFESHHGRAVCPDGVIFIWAVECGISECCSLITPVESLAGDHAVFNNRIVGTDKAKVICAARTEPHIFKCNCSCTVKTVITVVLCTEISRVRNFCTDIPPCFIGSLTYKCQVFSLGVSLAGNTVQCVVTFAQLDGIAASCSNHSRSYRLISFVTGCTDSRLLRIITIYRIHVDCFAANSRRY